jgi:beta-aspartyl-dipeptidase (metallo-type)
MVIVIEGGEVFAPARVGHADVLIISGSIQKIGKIDQPSLRRLELETEIVDARECLVVPGLIDAHQHILGGSGEKGFKSQTPEIHLSEIVEAGITTVVGCLGVDTTMKTMAGLLARAKALKEEGISAHIWSGGYNVPPTTITESIRDDIMFIEEVIGAGEIAIADERSTDPTPQELARLVNDAYVGGMLSGKAGVTHFHVGDGKTRLKLLRDLIDDFRTPPETLYPTHVERNEKLFEEAIALSHRGCFVDIDTAAEDLQKWVSYYFKHEGNPSQLTASSDASISSPSNLIDQLRACVDQSELRLEQLLPLVTTNPAQALKLEGRGTIKPGSHADLLILDRHTLELREVFAQGRRLFKEGKIAVHEAFLEDSNRSVSFQGIKSEKQQEPERSEEDDS